MALARAATKRRPSAKESTPAATKAENSPNECPATIEGWGLFNVEYANIECKKIAGCVTSVRRSSSSVPENIIEAKSKPS